MRMSKDLFVWHTLVCLMRARDPTPIPPDLPNRLEHARGVVSRAAVERLSWSRVAAMINDAAGSAVVTQPTLSKVLNRKQSDISAATLLSIERWLDEVTEGEAAGGLPSPRHSSTGPEEAAGDRSAPVPGLEPLFGDRQGAYIDALIRRVDRFGGAPTREELDLHAQLRRLLRLDGSQDA